MTTDPIRKSESNLLTLTNTPSEQILLAYLRHANHEPHAHAARATNLTPTTLTISFTRTTTSVSTLLEIPLHPPLAFPYDPSPNLERAIYAPTIPPVCFPRRPSTYLVLVWLLLSSLFTLLPPESTPVLLDALPLPRATLRLAGAFTLVVHALEACYAATLIKRAYGAGAVVQPLQLAGWILQTAIVGFPSLFLLMDAFAMAPPTSKRHN